MCFSAGVCIHMVVYSSNQEFMYSGVWLQSTALCLNTGGDMYVRHMYLEHRHCAFLQNSWTIRINNLLYPLYPFNCNYLKPPLYLFRLFLPEDSLSAWEIFHKSPDLPPHASSSSLKLFIVANISIASRLKCALLSVCSMFAICFWFWSTLIALDPEIADRWLFPCLSWVVQFF